MKDQYVLVTIYLTLFIASPLIIILHETGHALAYLLFTKPDNIDLYIGSAGDKRNTWLVRVGNFNYYIKKSLSVFLGPGLCVSNKTETNYRHRILILLGGVLFTFIIACIPALLVLLFHASPLVQMACYIFWGFAALSLLLNLIPANIKGIRNFMLEQSDLEKDGKQIIFTLRIRKVYAEYAQAMQCVMNKKYDEAIKFLQIVQQNFPAEKKILRRLSVLCIQQKRFDEAEVYLSLIEKSKQGDVTDMFNRACLYSFSRRSDEAIAAYQQVLKQYRNHILALNNLGYEMIKKGAHEVAAQIFEKVIKIKPAFCFAYCNLGYSKLIQGDLQEGKQYIDKALVIKQDCAPAYEYLAVYYLKLNKPYEAEKQVNKALEIDGELDLRDYHEELEKYNNENVVLD
jgi:tetratricopeptide (TPR) repeat protein